MLLRVVFFVLMALGLIGFGTVAWIATRPPPEAVAANAPPPVPRKAVLVAARTLHAGTLLKPEDIAAQDTGVPDESEVLLDSPEARRNLPGSMVRRSVTANAAIRPTDLMKPGDHGFLSAVLEPGMRAVTIGVDATSGAAGLIWPGDRVDLILTQALAEAALPPGQRVAAETVLSDARVIAIDQQLVAAASSGDSRTVTLEVTQAQAERVSVAMRLGRLSVSVRSADASAANTVRGSNTTWARDVSPALGSAPTLPTDNIVRVFQGSGEVREFKY
jgi:pilus assembly protein CpaB